MESFEDSCELDVEFEIVGNDWSGEADEGGE